MYPSTFSIPSSLFTKPLSRPARFSTSAVVPADSTARSTAAQSASKPSLPPDSFGTTSSYRTKHCGQPVCRRCVKKLSCLGCLGRMSAAPVAAMRLMLLLHVAPGK